MIGDELYIHGERADMGPDSGIQLTYRSNIFGDLGKIVGNNSSTIKLPVTGRNVRLIDGCVHPGILSRFPYASHAATLRRNGVEVVTGANLVLMKVGKEAIEVALTWGVSAALQNAIAGTDKLNDLEALVAPDGTAYTKVPYGSAEEGSARRWLPYYNQGLLGTDVKYNLPVVPVEDIIRGIERKYGITLNFGNDAYKEWAVPVTSMNGESGSVGITSNGSLISGDLPAVPLFHQGMRMNTRDELKWEEFPMYTYDRCYALSSQYAQGNTKMSADVYGEVTLFTFRDAQPTDIRLVIAGIKHASQGSARYIINDEDILADVRPISTQASGLGTKFVFNARVDVEVKRANVVSAFLYAGGKQITLGEYQIGQVSTFSMSMRAEYSTVSIDLEDALFSGEYPAVGNLPNLEVTKFVKAIQQMLGTYPVLTDASTIGFVPFGTLAANKSSAYDWSKYLVTDMGWLPDMEFKQGNEGRSNLFKYKDGDGDGWNGSFDIGNETLESEKTLVELPFKMYRESAGKAYIPLFSYAQDGDEYTMQFKSDSNAYVMHVGQDAGRSVATSDGIRWPQLLASYYQEYIGMLRDAKVITASFHMSVAILNGLDMSVPVYLKQYAAYFGIIELKTKANDIAEVKLIKL